MKPQNSRISLSLLNHLNKQNRKKDQNLLQKGFTLVELIVVVAIIAILAAVGIPAFQGVRDRAEAKALTGEAVGIGKECAVLMLEGETGSTVVNPSDGSAVTCDGSAAATVTSTAWTSGVAVDCLGVNVTNGASLAIATDGSIVCS